MASSAALAGSSSSPLSALSLPASAHREQDQLVHVHIHIEVTPAAQWAGAFNYPHYCVGLYEGVVKVSYDCKKGRWLTTHGQKPATAPKNATNRLTPKVMHRTHLQSHENAAPFCRLCAPLPCHQH